ncbi:carbamate kinase [Irregularibacter muris]|uniref:Carbamate kinase n=1 Tax=Irregularibacter muris TaxID=1796619 RepID=A0AAE3HHJ4_9FIRM|nr:carbamate kinase [Irregularibacter muris]MCR1899495.1 carbamate kinase [Irregularibacter muris]
MTNKRVVVALGGNALQDPDRPPTSEEQLIAAKNTAVSIVSLIKAGYDVILAHGNGPQVGRIVLASEYAAEVTPVIPFPECGAMSQGYIGYHLQQAIQEELRKQAVDKPVASIVTQVLVDKEDPAFQNPTKPIGAFYSEEEAKQIEEEKGYVMVEDAGRGYRRVVASPKPVDVVEKQAIKTLVDGGILTIAVGGGGIPVVQKEDGSLEGIPAVIDKDFAAEKLAEIMDADTLVILTGVEQVAINFNKPNQKSLDKINLQEAQTYIEEGHFAPGSMLPKVEAAMAFAKSKPGRKAIITLLDKAVEALEGQTGTTIVEG